MSFHFGCPVPSGSGNAFSIVRCFRSGGKVPLPGNGMYVVTAFLLLIPLGGAAPPAPCSRSA